MAYKNRVKELKNMAAGELMDNEGNWRIHPQFQQDGLDGSLSEVGIVDALKVYWSQRQGGLTLLDGHGRKALDPKQIWPVIVLDINDEEADAQLAMHDTLTSWAQVDPIKLNALVQQARVHNAKMQEAIERVRERIQNHLVIHERLTNEESSGKRKISEYQTQIDQSVKVVVMVEDLATVERAIRSTNNTNRGAALVEICKFYLDNKHEEH